MEEDGEEADGGAVRAKNREEPGMGVPRLSRGRGGAGPSLRHRLRRLFAIVSRSSSPDGNCSVQYFLEW